MGTDLHLLSPDELRAAVSRLRAAVHHRINVRQGGVPTFFDAYLAHLIEHLDRTESVHGWRARPPGPAQGDADDLVAVLRWFEVFLARHDHERLVTYASRREVARERACDIGPYELAMSQGIADCIRWKGEPLFKTAFDFAVMPMLLQELRPATILEIGSGTGASARWMADICATCGIPARVLSVDIEPVVGGDTEAVQFLRGDARDPASLFPAEVLSEAPRPWLVAEDAHANVLGVLNHFDPLLKPGDYLIVEDSRDKHDAIAAFVSDRYRVDTRYTDFFGRNATSAEDAIFAVLG